MKEMEGKMKKMINIKKLQKWSFWKIKSLHNLQKEMPVRQINWNKKYQQGSEREGRR